MKNNIFKSFRFEIVLYSMLSLLFTLMSETVLFLAIFLIYKVLNPYDIGAPSYPMEELAKNKAFNSRISNSYPAGGIQGPPISKGMLIILILFAIVVGIILFTTYFLILTKRFVAYLEEISQGITKIAAGDFRTRVSVKNQDEFTNIAVKLNQMAEEIYDLIENNHKNENTKNELITSVAHDLRTPLTSIIGYLDLVSRDENMSMDTRHRYVEIAYNKSRRLEKLIEDLFEFTKVTFGEITMEYTDLNIVKLLDQLADEFYPSFQENGLDFEFSTNLSEVLVRADGNMLARAFANLLSNAIKYGKDGKLVKLKLKKNPGKVIITLTNYGKLIPEEDLPYIFDRFYRVESSRSSETGGTGLGLAIAKSIILAHGGTITAKSDFEGTVFEITLNEKQKEGK